MRAVILLGDGFEESEFIYPYYRLLEAGFEVEVCSSKIGQVRSKRGCLTWRAEREARGLSGEDVDLILIPGGWGPDRLRRDPNVLRLVREVHGAGGIVAAICHGPQVLISAGLVRGRRMTGASSILDDLENAGAILEGGPVVVDGRVVTARGPQDLPEFMSAVVELAGGSGG